jgi:hypothetical protein
LERRRNKAGCDGFTPARLHRFSMFERFRAMSIGCSQIQAQFDELKVGDRVEIERPVNVGQERWDAKTAGVVIRVERRRHGLHTHRNFDDKVFSNEVLLELADGELTTVAVDEFTTIRHV